MDKTETEAEQIKKASMLFILGHGRSGTTLLQSFLNSHPNIVAPAEYEFIVHFYPRFGKIKHLTKKDITEFIEALYTSEDPHFFNWQLDKEHVTEKLISTSVNEDYPTLCKILISLTADNKTEIRILSDKNPINSIFVRKLSNIFPDAKFIHLIRDPRDSVYGYMRRLQQKNPFFLSRRWKRYNQVIDDFKGKFPERFFTLKYEDMVKNTDGTLNSIAAFLNITPNGFNKDYTPPEGYESSDGNQYYQNLPSDKREAVISNMKLAHENLSTPVNTSHIAKWKKEMNSHAVAVTEIITGKFAKKYGYEIEPRKIPGVSVSKYRLLKSKIVFYLWGKFTRWRYNNYHYNTKYKIKSVRKIINNMVK